MQYSLTDINKCVLEKMDNDNTKTYIYIITLKHN